MNKIAFIVLGTLISGLILYAIYFFNEFTIEWWMILPFVIGILTTGWFLQVIIEKLNQNLFFKRRFRKPRHTKNGYYMKPHGKNEREIAKKFSGIRSEIKKSDTSLETAKTLRTQLKKELEEIKSKGSFYLYWPYFLKLWEETDQVIEKYILDKERKTIVLPETNPIINTSSRRDTYLIQGLSTEQIAPIQTRPGAPNGIQPNQFPVTSVDSTKNQPEKSIPDIGEISFLDNVEKKITDLFSKGEDDNLIFSFENSEEYNHHKIDFLELEERNSKTGTQGELFALNWEKKQMNIEIKKGLGKVRHISTEDDSLGYDILSFCKDGSAKYIEVKTTTDKFNSNFYLTENEVRAMKKLENYFIYRVYNFNMDTKSGLMEIIDCKVDFEKQYKAEPISFKVVPKY